MVVAASDEPFGLRDRGLLESACAKPEHRWYYDQEDDTLEELGGEFGEDLEHAKFFLEKMVE